MAVGVQIGLELWTVAGGWSSGRPAGQSIEVEL